MTNETKKLFYKTRLSRIKAREGWYKTPGVVRKLERQIRNCDK